MTKVFERNTSNSLTIPCEDSYNFCLIQYIHTIFVFDNLLVT